MMMQNIAAPAGGTEDKAPADVTIHMQGNTLTIVLKLCKDLIAHEPGIETRDLFAIVFSANG